MKKQTIAAIVGVGAIGVAAFALTRGSNSQQKQSQPSSAFGGYSGGGATGGYSEPTMTQTVSSVLEKVLTQTSQSPALPEIPAELNPSDEAADVQQSAALSRDYVPTRATGDVMYSLSSVYSSLGGENFRGRSGTTRKERTLSGSRKAASLEKAVEYEEE